VLAQPSNKNQGIDSDLTSPKIMVMGNSPILRPKTNMLGITYHGNQTWHLEIP
jgi:hypothetical protein